MQKGGKRDNDGMTSMIQDREKKGKCVISEKICEPVVDTYNYLSPRHIQRRVIAAAGEGGQQEKNDEKKKKVDGI